MNTCMCAKENLTDSSRRFCARSTGGFFFIFSPKKKLQRSVKAFAIRWAIKETHRIYLTPFFNSFSSLSFSS